MKINPLSLSPIQLGERVRVRGFLADILYITPHLYPLPSRGEERSGDLFLNKKGRITDLRMASPAAFLPRQATPGREAARAL
jgi:hypothetical protein